MLDEYTPSGDPEIREQLDELFKAAEQPDDQTSDSAESSEQSPDEEKPAVVETFALQRLQGQHDQYVHGRPEAPASMGLYSPSQGGKILFTPWDDDVARKEQFGLDG